MKTLLLTGGTGFVGSRLRKELAEGFTVLAPTRAEMDFTDWEQVYAYVCQHTPAVIIHAGALAETGYCQKHPQDSFRVNVLGAENLAIAAKQVGAKLVYFSSDQVYNGSKAEGPHEESEQGLAPTNVYGVHKLEAERRVLAACPDAVCLRASWMYDLPVEGAKTGLGLVGKLYHAAITKRPLGLNSTEWRGITWVGLLVKQMAKITTLPGGIYNAGCQVEKNSLETGKDMAKLLGLSRRIVCSAAMPGRNLSMNCEKLRQQGVDLGSTVDGLRSCLAAYGLAK